MVSTSPPGDSGPVSGDTYAHMTSERVLTADGEVIGYGESVRPADHPYPFAIKIPAP